MAFVVASAVPALGGAMLQGTQGKARGSSVHPQGCFALFFGVCFQQNARKRALVAILLCFKFALTTLRCPTIRAAIARRVGRPTHLCIFILFCLCNFWFYVYSCNVNYETF